MKICNNSFSSLQSKLRMKARIMLYLKKFHITVLVLSLRKNHVLYQPGQDTHVASGGHLAVALLKLHYQHCLAQD